MIEREMMRLASMLMIAATVLLAARGAAAFVFADGSTALCMAGGQRVAELALPPGTTAAFTARTARTSGGHQILWNTAKMKGLPAPVHDFLFFHECAHARVPTQDELAANCAGLLAMRAAGRAGFAIESKLAGFYGAGNPYWIKTLGCANAPRPATPAGASPEATAPPAALTPAR